MSKKMIGIYAFGHGGGVPGAIPGTPVGNAGNTNFAIIPDLDLEEVTNVETRYSKGWEVAACLMTIHPYYLIDCGPETMLHLCGVMGGRQSVAGNLRGIFLTHTHDDHSGGIKSLAYRTKFIEQEKPFLAYPYELWPLLKQQMAEFRYLNPTVHAQDRGPHFFYYLAATNRVTLSGNMEVQAFPVDHNCVDNEGKDFPAFGYTLTTGANKKIVFSGDTAKPIESKFFTEADFIIHDVQFYNDGSKGDHVHCPYAWLRDAVPPEHRHKVLLTHTAHDLPPEAVQDGFRLLKGGTLIMVDA